jgi:hypothetical protein
VDYSEQTREIMGEGSRAERLGSTTNSATPPTTHQASRARKYKLQGIARELVGSWHRVSGCMRARVDGKRFVEVWHSGEHAHYSNLQVCGSVWVCPVCGAKVTEKRRAELTTAIVNNPELTPILITLTFQHKRETPLVQSLQVLTDAFRKLRSGSPWERLTKRYGLVASVTSLETTWGNENGFHPHKHLLLFSTLERKRINTEELKVVVSSRWVNILERMGYYASDLYGVSVEVGNEKVGNYVSKWGVEHEMTKGGQKTGIDGHYTPFQLLELYQTTSDEGRRKLYGGLFKEYARAFFGKRQLVWGRGSRELLGLLEPEKTDEEIAVETEEPSVMMARFTPETWKQVVQFNLRAEVLRVADRGNPSEIWELLETYGIREEP